MKFAFLILFVFGLCCNAFGQTKKQSIPVTAQIIVLQDQKKAAQAELERLRLKLSDSYPDNQKLITRIKSIDKTIERLATLNPSSETFQLLNDDLSINLLMKIQILQNERIIELLEALQRKK